MFSCFGSPKQVIPSNAPHKYAGSVEDEHEALHTVQRIKPMSKKDAEGYFAEAIFLFSMDITIKDLLIPREEEQLLFLGDISSVEIYQYDDTCMHSVPSKLVGVLKSVALNEMEYPGNTVAAFEACQLLTSYIVQHGTRHIKFSYVDTIMDRRVQTFFNSPEKSLAVVDLLFHAVIAAVKEVMTDMNKLSLQAKMEFTSVACAWMICLQPLGIVTQAVDSVALKMLLCQMVKHCCETFSHLVIGLRQADLSSLGTDVAVVTVNELINALHTVSTFVHTIKTLCGHTSGGYYCACLHFWRTCFSILSFICTLDENSCSLLVVNSNHQTQTQSKKKSSATTKQKQQLAADNKFTYPDLYMKALQMYIQTTPTTQDFNYEVLRSHPNLRSGRTSRESRGDQLMLDVLHEFMNELQKRQGDKKGGGNEAATSLGSCISNRQQELMIKLHNNNSNSMGDVTNRSDNTLMQRSSRSFGASFFSGASNSGGVGRSGHLKFPPYSSFRERFVLYGLEMMVHVPLLRGCRNDTYTLELARCIDNHNHVLDKSGWLESLSDSLFSILDKGFNEELTYFEGGIDYNRRNSTRLYLAPYVARLLIGLMWSFDTLPPSLNWIFWELAKV